MLGAMAWTIHAIHCEKPVPTCTFMYEDGCPAINETTCNASGGSYLNGGIQERCNLTLVTKENMLKTVLCQPPLVCTRVSDGICVEPQNCSSPTNDAHHVHQTIHIWTLTISLIFKTKTSFAK
ncbi:Protein of unknown function, partial [Gryllus bimaculatus]